VIDYQEYHEKKERERLEREKAAIGCHIADPNKSHHSHHHKPVSNTSMPNKQMPSVQKGTGLHHNHHHWSDMKASQLVQRHSTSSQPNPNRQRLSREHTASVAKRRYSTLLTFSC